MGYTIAKVTNAHIMSISDGTNTEYHSYHTLSKIYSNGDDVIIQIFGPGEKATSFRQVYTNIDAPSAASAQLTVDAIAALLIE
jgi:hypothetical protein